MVLTKQKLRIIVIVVTILIVFLGVFMVYDSSIIWANYKYGDSLYFFKRQLIFAIVGLIFFFIAMKININWIEKYSFIGLIISLILLIIVIIPGIGLVRGGSSSWLGIASFSFQPSELFKLTYIFFLSKEISKKYLKTNAIKSFIPSIIPLVIGILLIMMQPDFGTCMVICVSIFIMFFTTKLKYKYFIIAILFGIVGISILIISAPYRVERIYAFIDPFADPLGSGFQIIQSLFAIGPGGILGNGINSSIQSHYYLPEPQTDFIYAILIEEFGLLGGIILLILYSIIFYCVIRIILQENNKFKIFLSIGLISLFMVQVVINLGVVVGLFPVTGITLPLMSYGGSSLVVLLFSLGLILNFTGDKNENFIS